MNFDSWERCLATYTLISCNIRSWYFQKSFFDTDCYGMIRDIVCHLFILTSRTRSENQTTSKLYAPLLSHTLHADWVVFDANILRCIANQNGTRARNKAPRKPNKYANMLKNWHASAKFLILHNPQENEFRRMETVAVAQLRKPIVRQMACDKHVAVWLTIVCVIKLFDINTWMRKFANHISVPAFQKNIQRDWNNFLELIRSAWTNQAGVRNYIIPRTPVANRFWSCICFSV